MDMILESFGVQGRDFTDGPGGVIFSPKDYRPQQAIVYYHGWSSSVERSLFRGSILAMRGHCVLIPSVPRHDWRNPLVPNDRNMALYFWQCVEEAMEEFGQVADYLKKALGIAKENVAVAGHSMGGFIAGGILTQDPSVRCGVLYNASLDWEASREDFRAYARDIDDLCLEDCADYRVNPKDRIANLKGKAVFLTNGAEDRTVSRRGNDLFMEAYKDLGQKDMTISHQVYPGVGHVMTDHMLEDGLNFIATHL